MARGAPILYQSERSECGLVCLAMLAGAHGLRHDLASLRARYPVSLKGSTLAGLAGIAKDLSLETRALRCEIEDFNQVRLPAMLHWQMTHFVVLIKRRRGKFVVNDPAHGQITLTVKEVSEAFTGVVLEAWPGPKFQAADKRNRLKIETVIPRSPEVVRAIVSLFIYATAIEAITLAMPIVQQLLIDDALVTADKDLLVLLILAFGVFLIGQAATVAVRSIVQRDLSAGLSIIVPSHVVGHMLSLPADWFERRAGAEIMNRIESANTIHQTVTTQAVSAGIDGLVAIIAIAAMLTYNAWLSAIVVAGLAAYGVVRIISYGTIRRMSQGSLIHLAKTQGLLWETLRGISTIKLFNGLVRRHGQYVASLSEYVRLQNGIWTANAAFGFAHDLIFSAERLAILYFGAMAVLDRHFSVGMLVAFLSFRENFVAKATSLVNTAVQFRLLGVHLDRLSDILLTEREFETDLPFLGDRAVEGRIEAQDVTFRYGRNDQNVLSGCSLVVEPGEIVAITGPSGAGKSTLFKVLSGQLKPSSGAIYIDGRSIDSFGAHRLRDIVAVVSQDDTIFAGTIAENIACFEDHPDHDRVRDAAMRAGIHDEIQHMPMGYNTLIGSLGTGLSGGQKQRVTLARALYRRPQILLLDEATSHLDLDNERHVASALTGLGITQIIIAHRPQTIEKAHRVIDIREFSDASRLPVRGPDLGVSNCVLH